MNLNRMLKNTFYISIFSLIFSAIGYSQIVFNKFSNSSIYEGTWKLEYDVPDFIADYFREKFDFFAISPYNIDKLASEDSIAGIDKFELMKRYNINFTVDGRIKKFTINRFTAGEPKVVGYETYSVEIIIEFIITDVIDNKIIFQEFLENNQNDFGVGFNLFGRESESRKEFYSLDKIIFGSPDFMQTLVAKNLINISEQFAKKIQPFFKSIKKTDTINKDSSLAVLINPKKSNPFVKKIIKGIIVSLDEETKEVFLNLGSAEQLTKGDVLNVYALKDSVFDSQTKTLLGVTEKKIGEIEVIEVRGERFSLGIISKEIEKIQKNMEIRKIIVSPKQ